MVFRVNEIYHGFRLLEEKEVKELNSRALLFSHEKSGARLFILENEDDNKVFSITFRTPPEDSTGVPHILEHSVLCGSRKYPVKEPFVELAKGSLNTFLNAMTFSDKTMYPVASRNDQDFRNLMDVYLDAVFYPNIYKYPEILKQEGWHYHLEDENDDLTYKGVVYNEMKGAFSSPESILFRKIQESLFPDTPYGVESGGDPEVIPQLTQEQFEAFHKRYYHPSNSYIYLYGKIDVLEQLEYLDQAYLKDFDRIDIDSEIPEQKPFDRTRQLIVEYPISQGEKEEDKTFLSINFVVGRATDPELVLAMTILEYMLLETPAAPLKRALIEADLGKDVFGSFDHHILQPALSVVIKNSNEHEAARFEEVLFATLERLVREGIDKKIIESAINRIEFELREADTKSYPKGLIYGINSLSSWLYGESPLLHLQYESTLDSIKKGMAGNYFERLIQQHLIDNPHRSLLIVRPRRGLAEQKAEEVRKELAEYKAKLSEAEIKELVQKTKELQQRQNTPDAPEELECIPLLQLHDLDKEIEKLPLVEKNLSGTPVLAHPIFTNGIAYVNLYFDTRGVEQELLPYIALLAAVLGNVSTEKRGYQELSNEIDMHTGGIQYAVDVFANKDKIDQFSPKLIIKSKALADKIPNLFELIAEIVSKTRYEDKKRLKEILLETKSRLEMTIMQSGHLIAASRAMSYYSPVAKYSENLKGLSFYQFIVGLLSEFDAKFEEISHNLRKVAQAIFQQTNLLSSVTADEKDYGKFEKNFSILYQALGNQRLPRREYQFDLSPQNEGLLTSSKVQYVAKAYNFKKLGYEYSGSMQVLRTILSLDYLWNRVRVQGGAYGCMAGFDRYGNLYFTSYRDPNLQETLNVYNRAEDYVRSFNGSEREMTKYIIGTISRMDTPLTPSMKGERATTYYLSHVTANDLQKERDEVLNTKVEDIRNLADVVANAMEQNYICTLGNEDKIKENQSLFKKLIHVFE
jgi:hypothetical protein